MGRVLAMAKPLINSRLVHIVLSTLCVLLGLNTAFVFAADIDGVRLWRAPDNTRLVLDLSGPIGADNHRVFKLSNPDRIVVDIESSSLRADYRALKLDKTPINQIRSAVRNGKDVRLVLDLSAEVKPKSFVLSRNDKKPDRLVIDLFDKQAGKPVKTATEIETSGQRDIIIAIDAGHGGEDPGAVGPKINGKPLYEKNVALAISKQLKNMVDAEPGYRAELIRTGDYYIPLRKRRDLAREKRADLFVSIHADAWTHPSASGASVFALSQRGATSEMARFLAKKANEADLIGGVGSVSLEDKDKVLQGVLVDLSMTATLNTSIDVGSRVLSSMGSFAKLHKNHVEQAGFAVLKSPDVPSILVETGFISNPGEAKKLANSSYRKKMSRHIFKGIRQYFTEYPPAGTYIAARKAGKEAEHIIARGDTLSGIAERYNVSVASIKDANRLSGSVIRVGQRLVIPRS